MKRREALVAQSELHSKQFEAAQARLLEAQQAEEAKGGVPGACGRLLGLAGREQEACCTSVLWCLKKPVRDSQRTLPAGDARRWNGVRTVVQARALLKTLFRAASQHKAQVRPYGCAAHGLCTMQFHYKLCCLVPAACAGHRGGGPGDGAVRRDRAAQAAPGHPRDGEVRGGAAGGK